MSACRALLDVPRSGAWNMAIDEILLERAAAEDRCQLRIYGWTSPTLSLGYFQKAADRQEHAGSLSCVLVRRASGGGAIVHDRELTYALAVPGRPSAHEQRRLYRQMHAAIVGFLGRLGVRASLCQSADARGTKPPFLCFQRRTEGDVLLDGQKIAGSAQRRGARSALQHGSLLLRASSAAPELMGIENLSRVQMARSEWAALLLNAALNAFNWRPKNEPLSDADYALAAKLVEEKFGQPRWNEAR